MTQQPDVGPETSKWPHTRQDRPITTPPAPGIYTASPSAPPSGWLTPNTTFPPGLASLTHLDSIYIDPDIGPFEAVFGHNRKNRYVVMNDKREWLFHVQEDSSIFTRTCCGGAGQLQLKVYDRSRQEVLRFLHPMSYGFGKLEVYVGTRPIGKVHSKWAMYPKVEVQDHRGLPVFVLEGEAWGCICPTIDEWQVYSTDKSRYIGLITTRWSGRQSLRRFFSVDAFHVSFPVDLEVELKMLLIVTAIHLYYGYLSEDIDIS